MTFINYTSYSCILKLYSHHKAGETPLSRIRKLSLKKKNKKASTLAKTSFKNNGHRPSRTALNYKLPRLIFGYPAVKCYVRRRYGIRKHGDYLNYVTISQEPPRICTLPLLHPNLRLVDTSIYSWQPKFLACSLTIEFWCGQSTSILSVAVFQPFVFTENLTVLNQS